MLLKRTRQAWSRQGIRLLVLVLCVGVATLAAADGEDPAPETGEDSSMSGGYSPWINAFVSPQADTDEDGLTDLVEMTMGTDPTSPDSDGDGLPDGWEFWNSLNPWSAQDAEEDPDLDGLKNCEEYEATTLPFQEDTDTDGYWDGFEVTKGTDPKATESRPESCAVGDMDCNGVLDIEDVRLVLSATLQSSVPAPADLDGNGSVDSRDVQLVVNAVTAAAEVSEE